MTLKEIPKGKSVVVRQINTNEQTRRRLRTLGMLRGTPIEVVQRKQNGTLVIRLRGTRFALGKELSEQIEVEA
ncbi:FeoA family protein [Dubosiella newyorkensis]|uniref:FeoA family protein n=1 Tax=Dubosiella newyorkensis TaxID=1862672 RepID=UPI0024BB25BE|nr:FeoA family protein [Dubosiella newyorkensis]